MFLSLNKWKPNKEKQSKTHTEKARGDNNDLTNAGNNLTKYDIENVGIPMSSASILSISHTFWIIRKNTNVKDA